MFCTKCGNQQDSDAKFCTSCGNQIGNNNSNVNNDIYISANADIGSTGYYFLGAFVPQLVLILGLAWKKEKPISSKQIIVGGLIFLLEWIVILLMFMFDNSMATLLLYGGFIYLVYLMISKVNKQKKEYIAKMASVDNSNNQGYPNVNLKVLKKNQGKLTKAIILLVVARHIFLFILTLPHVLPALAVMGYAYYSTSFLSASYYTSPFFYIALTISAIMLGLSIYYFIKHNKIAKELKNSNN